MRWCRVRCARMSMNVMARSTALSEFGLTRSASSIARNAALKPNAILTWAIPDRNSGPVITGRTRSLPQLTFALAPATSSLSSRVSPRFFLVVPVLLRVDKSPSAICTVMSRRLCVGRRPPRRTGGIEADFRLTFYVSCSVAFRRNVIPMKMAGFRKVNRSERTLNQ